MYDIPTRWFNIPLSSQNQAHAKHFGKQATHVCRFSERIKILKINRQQKLVLRELI